MFAERVSRGIAILDEKAPAGWRQRINLETLRMSGLTSCVLGQVFGDYQTGCEAIWPKVFENGSARAYGDKYEPRDYGFTLYSYETNDFNALTAEWVCQLSGT